MSLSISATPPSTTKPKPTIPPKPSFDGGDATPQDEESSPAGKVKKIVDSLSQAATNSEPKVTKKAPTVKPKPRSKLIAPRVEDVVEQAPPLPEKRSRRLQQAKSARVGEEGSDLCIEGGRSAPDGKEVELQLPGGGEAEADHCGDRPLSPACSPGCGCACHLRRPGMKLIWVAIGGPSGGGEREREREEVDQGEGEEKDGGGEGQSKVDEEEDDDAGGRMRKTLFHHTLNAVISDTHRRRSDPGLNSLFKQHPRSPPVPSKRTHSSLAQLGPPPGEEEESVYETTLIGPTPTCKELDIPLIRVRKPQRRSKLPTGKLPTDPNSEFEEETECTVRDGGDAPPAIPPRMPTAQEWGALRSLSPNRPPPASGQLTPKRPPPTPPGSPSLGHRAPPLLPPHARLDAGRLSSASSHSLTSTKEQENGRPVAPPRRGSSFKWKSRLQDEPLYQTYRATVITKEIKRQTVSRNISKASADFTMDWAGRRTLPTTGPAPTAANTLSLGPRGVSPVPTPCLSTLWQDLAAVRDSGVLDTLSPEQCKYQESMFEVLTSEASYLRSLRVLIDHFLDCRELEDTLIIRDRKTLFSNILKIREASERFLKDLEERMDQELVFTDICDIIHYHAQHNFPAYIDYVRNQIYQEKTYTLLIKTNLPFTAVITRLQELPQCQRLPFMSFLLLPFQRITRIKMLIENILKRTKERTTEEQTASRALESVSKIVEECNTQVGKMKQMEELILLSRVLEFDKLKALPIISQTRYLEKKGELGEMSKGGTIFNLRAKFSPVHLYLFNDMLILATKKGPERFVVLDHAHRSLVQVEAMEEANGPGLYEHCFTLTLLENHQGRLMERLLKAPSQSDMHRWMVAFPNPNNPEGDVEEVIYDDWDCPQVQCVEQYVALQTDELTLEPTEIINVLRKTNEGWYEGSRLSDGQKGWFPVGSVVEITNEHVRRRNLRERYRVMQAAGQVAANSKARTST
ncbi:hypothetical protein NHX12_014434 [Muraenolepis orangiensis]|uniref:Rho guanine nucleotide exchange factor 15 n=1 Tax=Muraenolepis orangiensis TaxID=630683 RepID=A0A9Q0I569_9TELE|nr:hypothetical protein NHX12_014434 [Muraenolepis orangiensis]